MAAKKMNAADGKNSKQYWYQY